MYNAWRKDYKFTITMDNSIYNHYLVNDLLGQRIAITEQQYNNSLIIKRFSFPTNRNNLSQ